ncbi:unnamed protein product [Trichobilharzia regenti]|nr:unnamed protein product [Trichobilharzia regenti]
MNNKFCSKHHPVNNIVSLCDTSIKETNMELHTTTVAKLRLLEGNFVGGEQAGNKEVREKITRRRRYAEERRRRLAEANADLEDDGIMINIYESIQDELHYKSKALQKQKQKVIIHFCWLAVCLSVSLFHEKSPFEH